MYINVNNGGYTLDLWKLLLLFGKFNVFVCFLKEMSIQFKMMWNEELEVFKI